MKKINLVSGFGAKFAVAAFAVAGLTLTSCEKESFDVNVPNINIKVPEVDIPEAEDGIAYVILSATSASGNALEGVKFTSNGSDIETTTSYKAAATFTVTASKEGYLDVTKVINVPAPQKGSFTTTTVEFVLTAETADFIPTVPTPGDVDDSTIETVAPVETTITNGAQLTEGEHTIDVYVPMGVKYTAEQIAELYVAVSELEGPVTRALDAEGQANLAKAKEMLRTQIANLRTEWATTAQPVTYTVSGGNATSLTVEVTTTQGIAKVTLSVSVAEETYEVEGECTVAVSSSVKVIDVKGEDISHSHGHGHGDSNNAGGGTGNGQA